MDMHTLEAYYSHHTPTLQDASGEYAVLIPIASPVPDAPFPGCGIL